MLATYFMHYLSSLFKIQGFFLHFTFFGNLTVTLRVQQEKKLQTQETEKK